MIDTENAPAPTATDRDPIWDELDRQEAASRDAARADLAQAMDHLTGPEADARRDAASEQDEALGAIQEALETGTTAASLEAGWGAQEKVLALNGEADDLAAAILATLEARGLSIVRKPW